VKILITGCNGMFAADLIRALEAENELVGRDVHDADICDREAIINEIGKIKPDWVINCAAYTQVDNCEAEKDLAYAVNAEGVRNLAMGCRAVGSLLCHISTDFVFDGSKNSSYDESDPVNPLSVYGRSKLQGEQYIQEILKDFLIVRTSWLFGPAGKNFVATIRKLCQEREVLEVVDDQTGSPTFTRDLAAAVQRLMDVSARGIFHVCNSGACTWFGFAGKICELTGGRAKVVPVSSVKNPRPAVRPAYSVMNCSRFEKTTGQVLRHWEDALQEYLEPG